VEVVRSGWLGRRWVIDGSLRRVGNEDGYMIAEGTVV
jgi:hypothetical protein